MVQQHSERKGRLVKSYERWARKIPGEYAKAFLDHEAFSVEPSEDPAWLGLAKNYLSLMAMAENARKPVFSLKPADGAIGAHSDAVRQSYLLFKSLTQRLLEAAGV